jgi:hypothetical protein
MTADISTKTHECGGNMVMSDHPRLHLGVTMRFILTGLIVLLLSAPTLPSYANDSAPMPARAVNPTLPGARAGILTKAQGTMLLIDRTEYSLAPVAAVEDRFGTPLSIQDLQCNEAQYRVRYWTVPHLGHDQILQLIVTFPE